MTDDQRRPRQRQTPPLPAPMPAPPREPTGSPPDPPAPGRAGRNVPVAIGVGVGMGAVVVGSLLVVKAAFVGVALAAILLALHELTTVLARRQVGVPVVPLALGAAAMLVGAYAGGPRALVLALALTLVAVLTWRLTGPVAGFAGDVSASALAALWVPFLASFAMLMLAAPDGDLRVIAFIVVTVASDIGGYAAGVLFGRHEMAPRISPKKTWEGFAGSALACVGLGAAAVSLLPHGHPWQGAVVGLAAVLSATLGDLVESMVKRDLGVKDMGTLLPGHGGMMDRLDSLLLTAPVVYLLLTWLVPA